MAGEAEWELFYWTRVKDDGKNHMIGRGEFVRLIFEAAGVKYHDRGMEDHASVTHFVHGGGNTGFPVFAPPVIKRGDFVLSQTPTILRYLGKQFGLYPENPEDEAHADALMGFLTDFVAEGRLVFHPKCFTASYYEQIEEAKGHVAWFEEHRLPKFLSYLEKVLARSESGWAVGQKMTYVDIGLFHTLVATQSQFPTPFTKALTETSHLQPFVDKVAAVPNIAAYLTSERRGFFEGNSMM